MSATSYISMKINLKWNGKWGQGDEMPFSLSAWIPLTPFKLLPPTVSHVCELTQMVFIKCGISCIHSVGCITEEVISHAEMRCDGGDDDGMLKMVTEHFSYLKHGAKDITYIIYLYCYIQPIEGYWNSKNLTYLLIEPKLVSDRAKINPKSDSKPWPLSNIQMIPYLVWRVTHEFTVCWTCGMYLISMIIMVMESCPPFSYWQGD